MNYVLGISCFFHDSSAALISDKGIVAASEEERFSRVKHDSRFPSKSIKFCLQQAGIQASDLTAVVFYEDPVLKFDRIIKRLVKNFPKSLKIILEVASNWHEEKFWFKEIVEKKLGIKKSKIFFSNHHSSHLSSVFFTNNLTKSAFLTIDGVGEWEMCTGGLISEKKKIKNFNVNYPHSLGLLYSTLTEFLGFEVNEGEFKVMGMAAYGEPKYVDKIEKLFIFRNKKGFELDLDFFEFEYSLKTNLSKKFLNLFGQKREKNSPFFKTEEVKQGSFSIFDEQKYYADIAASIQEVLNNQVLQLSTSLFEDNKVDNLCYAGGVAYNGVINSSLMRYSGFKNIYIPPVAGDNGAALGCALNYYNQNISANNNSYFLLENSYLGKEYNNDEIIEKIKKYGYHYEEIKDEKMIEFLSEQLNQKKIIGLFRGRFEFGPRALGNRSIIADPRSIEMKNIINKSIKFREIFRPFAPVVLDKYANEYFDLDIYPGSLQPFKFMTSVANVRDKFLDKLQCVAHVNKSSRIQILEKKQNKFLYDLIDSFGKLSGVYCLVNTSFNLRGEPMVASPEDALKTFSWSNIDFLILENFLVKKY